jgi:hypothetical protein
MRTHQDLPMVETDACLCLLNEAQQMSYSTMMQQLCHDVAVLISVPDELQYLMLHRGSLENLQGYLYVI